MKKICQKVESRSQKGGLYCFGRFTITYISTQKLKILKFNLYLAQKRPKLLEIYITFVLYQF